MSARRGSGRLFSFSTDFIAAKTSTAAARQPDHTTVSKAFIEMSHPGPPRVVNETRIVARCE